MHTSPVTSEPAHKPQTGRHSWTRAETQRAHSTPLSLSCTLLSSSPAAQSRFGKQPASLTCTHGREILSVCKPCEGPESAVTHRQAKRLRGRTLGKAVTTSGARLEPRAFTGVRWLSELIVLPLSCVHAHQCLSPRSAHRNCGVSHPPGRPASPPLLGAIHLIAAPHHGLLKGESWASSGL